jgi:hypothetical protein
LIDTGHGQTLRTLLRSYPGSAYESVSVTGLAAAPPGAHNINTASKNGDNLTPRRFTSVPLFSVEKFRFVIPTLSHSENPAWKSNRKNLIANVHSI